MHPHIMLAAGHATQHAINLAALRMGHLHAQALAKLKANVLEMMATQVTAVQIMTIRDNFRVVATMLAEEARHHMSEQTKDADIRRTTKDPRQRARMDASIDRINKRLGEIQAAALSLHEVTSKFIVAAAAELAETADKLGLSGDPIPLPPELELRHPLLDVESFGSVE